MHYSGKDECCWWLTDEKTIKSPLAWESLVAFLFMAPFIWPRPVCNAISNSDMT